MEVGLEMEGKKDDRSLLIEIMKSLNSTPIVSGLTSNRSLLWYICGYRLCTAFSAASVHSAYKRRSKHQRLGVK
jgi:hypothetical protein